MMHILTFYVLNAELIFTCFIAYHARLANVRKRLTLAVYFIFLRSLAVHKTNHVVLHPKEPNYSVISCVSRRLATCPAF